jgi:hypothetical protein
MSQAVDTIITNRQMRTRAALATLGLGLPFYVAAREKRKKELSAPVKSAVSLCLAV